MFVKARHADLTQRAFTQVGRKRLSLPARELGALYIGISSKQCEINTIALSLCTLFVPGPNSPIGLAGEK